jgi:hypothetical protein
MLIKTEWYIYYNNLTQAYQAMQKLILVRDSSSLPGHPQSSCIDHNLFNVEAGTRPLVTLASRNPRGRLLDRSAAG